MELRLFRMGIIGKVAVSNLALIGLILVTRLIAFPEGVIDVDSTPRNMLLLASVLDHAIIVLSFPVGWMTELATAVSGPPIAAIIFVPLNAYFWGYVASEITTRVRRSRRMPTESSIHDDKANGSGAGDVDDTD